jgi:hypothetical protein
MDLERNGASWFYVLLDMKNKDVFDKLQDSYGQGCVSYVWVGKWTKAFREDQISLPDDRRSERSAIPDGVECIRAKIACKPYQSGPDTARDLGLPKIYILEVLNKVLRLKRNPLL